MRAAEHVLARYSCALVGPPRNGCRRYDKDTRRAISTGVEAPMMPPRPASFLERQFRTLAISNRPELQWSSLGIRGVSAKKQGNDVTITRGSRDSGALLLNVASRQMRRRVADFQTVNHGLPCRESRVPTHCRDTSHSRRVPQKRPAAVFRAPPAVVLQTTATLMRCAPRGSARWIPAALVRRTPCQVRESFPYRSDVSGRG